MFKADQNSGKLESVSAEGQSEAGAESQSQPVRSSSAQLTTECARRRSKLKRKQPKRDQRKQQVTSCQSSTPNSCKVPLVGKKSLLKCLIGGYPVTVLFDSGSQVSLVDRQWVQQFIPNYQVRPLQELLNDGLEVYAVNGQAVPYDGWVELTVTLAGHEDPNLTVQAPFLVSNLSLPQPLLGANVLGAIIQAQESDQEASALLYSLLRKAFGTDEEQVMPMVNFIQAPQRAG